MPAFLAIAAGGAIAGGVGSIMGGFGQAKAAKAQAMAQNRQAQQNFIQSNTNKTFANAREQFQASYLYTQQLKRNSAIAEAAYRNQYEQMENLQNISTFQQSQLSKQTQLASSSLLSAVASKGISKKSGLYASLAISQALDAMNNSNQLKKNYMTQVSNINKQFKNEMSQQTENIYMPNIQIYDAAPVWANTNAGSSLALAGALSGAAQIAGGVAGLAIGPKPSGD